MLRIVVCVAVFGFGLSAGLVMAQWDGTPSSPLSAASHPEFSSFDIQIHSRDASTWGDNSLESMQAQHGADCLGPPSVHEHHSYASAVFTCNNHVMTAINASGYGLIVLTPAQLLNCSASCSVQWDMSTERQSTRDWPDVWLTPWSENLTLPFDEGDVDLQGRPRSGVVVSGNNPQSTWTVDTIANYSETAVSGCWWCSWRDAIVPGTNQAAVRQTFKLTITPGRIKMERLASSTAPQLTFVDAPAPVQMASDYVVQFGHHSYNPTKDGAGVPATWHWDNFILAPAAPFTVIHTPTRSLTGTSGSITFNAPAPGDSWMRFTALGSVQYSLNGGGSWQPATKQAFINHYEHQSPYFIPLPAGSQAVQIRLAADSWYQGPFIAKDFAVWSLTVIPTSPGLHAPSNLSVQATGSTGLTLFFNDHATSETGFDYERRLATTDSWSVVLSGGALPGTQPGWYWPDSNVAPGTTYCYRLRAKNATLFSYYSHEACGTTAGGGATLPAPSHVAASSGGPGTLNVSFTDNATTETAIDFERRIGQDGNWSLLFSGSTLPGAQSGWYWPDSAVSAGITFCYRLRARNGNVFSPYSNEACATAPAGGLAAPTNVSVFAAGAGTFNVSFTDNATTETGIEYERRTGQTGTWSIIHSGDALPGAQSGWYWPDSTVSAGTTYCYRLRAKNGATFSPYSSEVCGSTPVGGLAAPSNVSASPGGTGIVSVSFTDNATTETGFDYERRLGQNGNWSVIFAGTALPGAQSGWYWPDSSVSSGTTYCYRLRTKNGSAFSPYSNIACGVAP
jgi:hypothetical protein